MFTLGNRRWVENVSGDVMRYSLQPTRYDMAGQSGAGECSAQGPWQARTFAAFDVRDVLVEQQLSRLRKRARSHTAPFTWHTTPPGLLCGGGSEGCVSGEAAARLRGCHNTAAAAAAIAALVTEVTISSCSASAWKMPSSNKRAGEELDGEGILPVHEAAGRLFENVGLVGGARKKVAGSTRTGQACDRCKVSGVGLHEAFCVEIVALLTSYARSARLDAMRDLAAARLARRTTPSARPPTASPAARLREATQRT